MVPRPRLVPSVSLGDNTTKVVSRDTEKNMEQKPLASTVEQRQARGAESASDVPVKVTAQSTVGPVTNGTQKHPMHQQQTVPSEEIGRDGAAQATVVAEAQGKAAEPVNSPNLPPSTNGTQQPPTQQAASADAQEKSVPEPVVVRQRGRFKVLADAAPSVEVAAQASENTEVKVEEPSPKKVVRSVSGGSVGGSVAAAGGPAGSLPRAGGPASQPVGAVPAKPSVPVANAPPGNAASKPSPETSPVAAGRRVQAGSQSPERTQATAKQAALPQAEAPPPPVPGKPPIPTAAQVKKKGRFVVVDSGAPTAPQTNGQPATMVVVDRMEESAGGQSVAVVQHLPMASPAEQVNPVPPEPAVNSKEPRHQQPSSPAAERPRSESRGTSMTKPPASIDRKGVPQQQGLGKVFYFLDQMRQEVTDADKTIKTLQAELKFFKEKNKELEARARDMEKKWTEEKAAREDRDNKVRTLKKKVKELKGLVATTTLEEETPASKPNSRQNSVDSSDGEGHALKGISFAASNSSSEKSLGTNPSQLLEVAAHRLSTIESSDANRLAEKQEKLDLKKDQPVSSLRGQATDAAPGTADKKGAGIAKKLAKPPQQTGDEKAHKRTESLGGSPALTFPHQRRVASEDNMSVFLGTVSAPHSPTEMQGAPPNVHQPNGAGPHRPSAQGFNPLGKAANDLQPMPGTAAGQPDHVGFAGHPGQMLHHAKSNPHMNMAEGNLSMSSLGGRSMDNLMYTNQGMMYQQQGMQMNQQPQPMQGGIPMHQMQAQNNWNPGAVQQPQMINARVVGAMNQQFQQQQMAGTPSMQQQNSNSMQHLGQQFPQSSMQSNGVHAPQSMDHIQQPPLGQAFPNKENGSRGNMEQFDPFSQFVSERTPGEG